METTEALQLRFRLIASVRALHGANLRRVVFKISISLIQIIAFIVALALSRKQPCDQPLRAYLACHVVRLALTLPAVIYASLVPPAVTRRDTREEVALRELARTIGSAALDLRIRRISDLLSIASVVLFVLANIYVFSSNSCVRTSPLLYYTSLAAVCISYLYIAEVLAIVLAVLFFLPLFIFGMRLLGLGPPVKQNEIGPLDAQALEKIPLVIYAPAPSSPSTTDPFAIPVEGDITVYPPKQSTPVIKAKGRWIRLIKPKHRNAPTTKLSPAENSPYPYVYLPENLSSCSICLSDYDLPQSTPSPEQTEELLRQLPVCRHCFHRDCVDAWLLVSGRCPVCQAPVFESKKGKNISSV